MFYATNSKCYGSAEVESVSYRRWKPAHVTGLVIPNIEIPSPIVRKLGVSCFIPRAPCPHVNTWYRPGE